MIKIILIFFSFFISTSVFAKSAYFPIKTQVEDGGVSAFEANWYGKSLERMKEPSLLESKQNTKAVIYRFMILPTWGNPISIRVWKDGKIYNLSARRLDGQGGYDPGILIEQKDVKLSEKDSKALDTLIANLNFFQMQTNEEVIGSDGDKSILEGVLNGKYHIVQRWCAFSHETKKRGLERFVALFKFLIDKSTLSETPKNVGYEILSPS